MATNPRSVIIVPPTIQLFKAKKLQKSFRAVDSGTDKHE